MKKYLIYSFSDEHKDWTTSYVHGVFSKAHLKEAVLSHKDKLGWNSKSNILTALKNEDWYNLNVEMETGLVQEINDNEWIF